MFLGLECLSTLQVRDLLPVMSEWVMLSQLKRTIGNISFFYHNLPFEGLGIWENLCLTSLASAADVTRVPDYSKFYADALYQGN